MVSVIQHGVFTKSQMMQGLRERGGFRLPVDRATLEKFIINARPCFEQDRDASRISLEKDVLFAYSDLYSCESSQQSYKPLFIEALKYLQNILSPAFNMLLDQKQCLLSSLSLRRQNFNLNPEQQVTRYLLGPHIDYYTSKEQMFTVFSEAFYYLGDKRLTVANSLSTHDLQHKYLGKLDKSGNLPERHPKSSSITGIPMFGVNNRGDSIAIAPEGSVSWQIDREIFKPVYHSVSCSPSLTEQLIKAGVSGEIERFTIVSSGKIIS